MPAAETSWNPQFYSYISPSTNSQVPSCKLCINNGIMESVSMMNALLHKRYKAFIEGGQMVSPVRTDTNQLLVNIRSSLRSRHNYSKQLLAAISEDLSR